MSARTIAAAALVALPLVTLSCTADAGDVLPGHSRPVFEHDWPHPRELEFEDGGFQPADPARSLVVTAGGTRAWIIEDHADPLALVMAAVPLGRQYEADGEAGAADVVVRLLGRRLSELLGAGAAAGVQVSQELDLTRLSVEVLAEDWLEALTALVRTLREPGLTPSAVGTPRAAGPPAGGGATRPVAELTRLVGRYPLAPPDSGIPVRPESVRNLGERALQPGTIVFGIAGGVAAADAEAALNELTSAWTPPPGNMRATARPATFAAARTQADPLHTIDEPGFMSWLAVGHAMAPIERADEAAVAVMAEIVNIRLNIETREIRGLTNRALLVLPAATDGAGLLHVRTSGRSESVGPLIRHSVEVLSRIRTEDGAPTDEELQQAKGGLTLGRWQDSLDGARRTAATYALETVRRGSLDHLMAWPAAVRAVTAEDVSAAARRYIDPGSLTAVVVGQIDAVRAARHPRWPVTLEELPTLLRQAHRP